MSQNDYVLGFQSSATIDLDDLKSKIRIQKKLISENSKKVIIPEHARTYIRIIKQMPKMFKELYSVEEFAEFAIGVSKTTFEKWAPTPNTYDKPAFKSAWDRVRSVAQIQMLLVKIYQNKESIISAVISKNKKFEESFYEIIMGNDIEKQLELKSFLESVELGR